MTTKKEKTEEIAINAVAEMLDSLTKEIAEIKTLLASNSNDLVQQVQHLQEEGCEYVRDNPGKSALILLGIGFFIGLLTKR